MKQDDRLSPVGTHIDLSDLDPASDRYAGEVVDRILRAALEVGAATFI